MTDWKWYAALTLVVALLVAVYAVMISMALS